MAFGLPEFGQVNNERPYRLEINWAFWLPILAGFVLIAAAVYRLRGGTSSSQTKTSQTKTSQTKTSQTKTSQTRVARGFTLVELLVVIAIVGVLVGITLPAVQAVRSSARRTECLNNIRQISLGVLNYESSHRRFPVGIHAPDHDKFASLSWLAQILPYVEQAGMWQQTKSSYLSLPSPFWPHVNLQTPVPIYECPSIPTSGLPQWTHENKLVALTSYLGVNGTNYLSRDGIFYQQSRTRPADVADGLSNTLLIGERPPSADFWYGWWYAGHGQDGSGSPDMLLGVRETNDGAQFAESCEPGPYHFVAGELDEQCDLFHFWSVHPGGANFAMADGSVRWFAYTADEVMPALATRNGREVVQWPN